LTTHNIGFCGLADVENFGHGGQDLTLDNMESNGLCLDIALCIYISQIYVRNILGGCAFEGL